MKTLILFLAGLAAILVGTSTATAHAIWIESPTKATKHKAHEVKIVYGDYAEGVVEPTAKWYSDLKTLEVWVTGPAQQKTRLTLTDAGTHLVASFVPEADGLYYLSTVHATRELGGSTKYEFSSVTPVLVGRGAAALAPPAQPLAIVVAPRAYKANEPVEAQVWKAGQVFKNGKVELMSPEGWVKTVQTDANGKLVFTPKLKGSYVLEASDYQEQAGEWHQKKYTHFWQGSTTRILIN
ncbi:DUF4198 domain-containing protein [Hymenobacter sp. B81]|uniref:DUF4198 domain-containing protein n=1 Tax=Hymenobacter sp. B81 TaxID=3344878 RepID=UPI0037DC27D8